jgi:hypothetical protein
MAPIKSWLQVWSTGFLFFDKMAEIGGVLATGSDSHADDRMAWQ